MKISFVALSRLRRFEDTSSYNLFQATHRTNTWTAANMLKTIQSQLMKIEHGSYSIFSKGQKNNPEKTSAFTRQQKGIVLDEHFPSSVVIPSIQFSTRLPLRETPCSAHNPSFEPQLKSRLVMAPAVQSAVQDSLVFPIQ